MSHVGIKRRSQNMSQFVDCSCRRQILSLGYHVIQYTTSSSASVLLSSSMPTALKSESATTKKNPSLQLRLSLLGFLFQGAGAQVWGEGDVNCSCSLRRSAFPHPSPTARVNPGRAWTAGEFCELSHDPIVNPYSITKLSGHRGCSDAMR